jgi:hypothetical protein
MTQACARKGMFVAKKLNVFDRFKCQIKTGMLFFEAFLIAMEKLPLAEMALQFFYCLNSRY